MSTYEVELWARGPTMAAPANAAKHQSRVDPKDMLSIFMRGSTKLCVDVQHDLMGYGVVVGVRRHGRAGLLA
jgi:hypothetical protein